MFSQKKEELYLKLKIGPVNMNKITRNLLERWFKTCGIWGPILNLKILGTLLAYICTVGFRNFESTKLQKKYFTAINVVSEFIFR